MIPQSAMLQTTIRVLKERLNKIWFLVHESSIRGWGYDNNVFLPAVDVCVVDPGDYARLGSAPRSGLGEWSDVELEGIPVRLWTPAALGLSGAVNVTDCPAYGCSSLEPALVLKTIPLSPDVNQLREQIARLAMIVHVHDLTDEELAEFARYVRGD